MNKYNKYIRYDCLHTPVCPTPGPPTPRHPENAEIPYSGGLERYFRAPRDRSRPRGPSRGRVPNDGLNHRRARVTARRRDTRTRRATRPIVRARANDIHARTHRRDNRRWRDR
jgi:hypothetical protein